MKFHLILLFLSIFVLSGCGSYVDDISTENAEIEISENTEITIPDGYILFDVAAYGMSQNNEVFFCQNIETSRIYVCYDGNVGVEVIAPDGYTIVAISAYGRTNNNQTYYCQHNLTGKIYRCNIDE